MDDGESRKHIFVETKFKLKNKMVYMIISDKKSRGFRVFLNVKFYTSHLCDAALVGLERMK